MMSHYNFIAHREYKALAELARRTGETEEVVEDMEYMADYFWRLLGGNSNPDKKRKPKPKNYKDGFEEKHRYEIGGEWSQERQEEG